MASPFSFHCMICIEEFDQRDRYPVVLPCGHTYVCNQCAERLTKCMECRETLLIPMETPAPNQPMLSYRPAGSLPSDRSRGRLMSSGGRTQNQLAGRGAPRPPVPRKRLPLPKNVVLMSLMEATEAVTATPTEIPTISSLQPEVDSHRNTAILDDDEIEEEKIRFSTSLVASACGTYVVTTKKRIHIFPSKPSDQDGVSDDHRQRPFASENEDIDAMVRFFHLDHKMAINSSENSGGLAPAVQLSRGDRIQIVSIDAGWAKLARGYGYVRAGKGEIAKVSGSVDRACKMEALLRSISLRRKELREEQRKVDSQFVTLMQDLQTSLLNDEDLTVIGADTFTDVDGKIFPKSSRDEENENNTNDAQRPPGNLLDDDVRQNANNEARRPVSPDSSSSFTDLGKPHRMHKVDSPTNIVSSSLGCFSQDIFGGCGGRTSSHGTTTSHAEDLSASAMESARMVAGIMGALSFPDETSFTDASNNSARVLAVETSPHPSPRAMSAGARAWRERNNRSASSAIDFKTGMSGHMALLSTRANHSNPPHDYLSRGSGASWSWGRMSAHSGLTFGTSRRQPKASPPPSPNSKSSYDYDDSRTI